MMPKSTLIRSVVMSLLCVGSHVVYAQGSGRDACRARAYALYAAQQMAYQADVERLAIAKLPQMATLARLARTEQSARIEARERAVTYLLQNDPKRLRLDRDVSQWLDWGASESAELALVDHAYALLHAKVSAARQAVSAEPDWPRFQQQMRELISGLPEHRKAIDRVVAASRVRADCSGS